MSSIHIYPVLCRLDSLHSFFYVYSQTYLHESEECLQTSMPARKKLYTIKYIIKYIHIDVEVKFGMHTSSCEILAKLLVPLQCGVLFSVRKRFI
jgi:hypothetical protein